MSYYAVCIYCTVQPQWNLLIMLDLVHKCAGKGKVEVGKGKGFESDVYWEFLQ